MTASNTSKTALIILHEGCEEMEAVAPIDILVRASVSLTVAAAGDSLTIRGRSGIQIIADHLLKDVANKTYDAVIIPGGPGINALRSNTLVLECIQAHHQAGKLIAAICAAPLLFKDANILPGPPHTAHFTTETELPAIDKSQAVITDNNIITSQGAGTATVFALAIVDYLISPATSTEIAQSICLAQNQ